MFPYRNKNADSESDITNKKLIYKINQKSPTCFRNVGQFRKEKTQTDKTVYFMIHMNFIIRIF